MSRFPQVEVQVAKIINYFFGETITVAGLITAGDMIEQLKDMDLGDELIIPEVMLKADEPIFLDDLSVSDVEKALDIKISASANDGYEYLEKITIHHLLCMTAGKQTSIRGSKSDDWLKLFVNAKWIFEPGTSWRYVNDNYYVASKMLCKVLGESITKYLTPRLFEPLGIDVPFWEHSPDGVEAGGWGLMLKTEDIAKFILCYQNKGIYNDVQVIPEWWIKEATGFITDNSVSEKEPDASAGYGCGFWRCAGMPNTYRAEGMFCQYAISFEDYKACLIMTSEHSGLQETLDVIKQMGQAGTDADEIISKLGLTEA